MRSELKARLIGVWRIVQLGHGFSCGRLEEGTDLESDRPGGGTFSR